MSRIAFHIANTTSGRFGLGIKKSFLVEFIDFFRGLVS